MLVTAIATIAGGIVVLWIVAAITRFLGGEGVATFVLQSITTTTIALALFVTSTAGLQLAVAFALLPVFVRIFAIVWFYYIGKKVLNGDYGEESMWAAQLTDEGDTEFIEASTEITNMEMKEIGIVANSKQELRELVVERAREDDES